jgi:hypothetical protein
VSTSTESLNPQPSIDTLGAVDTTSNLFADFDQQLEQYLPVAQSSTGLKSQQGQYTELSSLAAAQNRTIFPAGVGNPSSSQQGVEHSLTGHAVPGVDMAGNGSLSWADMGIPGTTMEQPTPSPLASLFDPANGNSVTSTLRLKNSEDLAEWVDICFFLSLHTRHQHALVPLVHQPPFAQDVLHRRDQRDESFRSHPGAVSTALHKPWRRRTMMRSDASSLRAGVDVPSCIVGRGLGEIWSCGDIVIGLVWAIRSCGQTRDLPVASLYTSKQFQVRSGKRSTWLVGLSGPMLWSGVGGVGKPEFGGFCE